MSVYNNSMVTIYFINLLFSLMSFIPVRLDDILHQKLFPVSYPTISPSAFTQPHSPPPFIKVFLNVIGLRTLVQENSF